MTLKKIILDLRHFKHRWLSTVISIKPWRRTIKLYRRYLLDKSRYATMLGAEELRFIDSYPCIFDAVETTPFDAHYFYQAIWATERIKQTASVRHMDAGSDHAFVGLLSTNLPVVFVDIRPLTTALARLSCIAGDLLRLPIQSNSVQSLSCLHVAEHVGLGRYGDALNPFGTQQACAELTRVLSPGGNLFFSLPIGKTRVCYNAHRIHSPTQILEYCKGLELVEFSAIDDDGKYLLNIAPTLMAGAEYACGLFWFRRS